MTQPRKESTKLLYKMTEEEKTKQAVDIFIDHWKNNITIDDLAKKYHVSQDTVKDRLKTAKQFLSDEIHQFAQQELPVILQQYEYLFEEAKREWETTKNHNFLKAMQAVLKDKGDLLSVGMPGKLPKSETGRTMADQQVIIVVNDAQYADREKRLSGGDVLEGDIKVLDSGDES